MSESDIGDEDRDRADSWEKLFEKHLEIDAQITSNLVDGAVVDINGTDIKIMQRDRNIPMLVELYIESEENPIGAVNIATGETVCLGGVSESLADRVKEIRQMPVEDIPDALEDLEKRLNPTGR